MKNIFISVLLLLLFQLGQAQDIQNKPLVQQVKKVNILYPGYEQEKPVGEKTTWGYSLGTRFWYGWGTSYNWYLGSSGNYSYLNVVPSIELYGRWYYNLAKRSRKYKRIAHNSASYFTTGAAAWFDGIGLIENNYSQLDHIYSGIYVGWGWRRTFGRRVIFDMHLKFQPTFEDDRYGGVLVLPGIHIGYLLFK